MPVSDVSWFKDGLLCKAVMRKYSRFSILFFDPQLRSSLQVSTSSFLKKRRKTFTTNC